MQRVRIGINMDYIEIEFTVNEVGKESIICGTCKKKTEHKVFYKYPKVGIVGKVFLGPIAMAASPLIFSGMGGGYDFLFECGKCGISTNKHSESFEQLKKRFGYSKLTGFNSQKFAKKFKVTKESIKPKNTALEPCANCEHGKYDHHDEIGHCRMDNCKCEEYMKLE